MDLLHINSLLFCPANRPNRYEKALSTSADCIIFDWEDAVPMSEKTTTRIDFLAWFTAQRDKKRIGIRINSVKTLCGIEDLVALAKLSSLPEIIVLPKVEDAAEVRIAISVLQKTSCYVATIETARGIHNAVSIAKANKMLGALLVGAGDLSSDLRCENSKYALTYANSAIISAAAQAGIACIDTPYFDLHNEQGLQEDTLQGKKMGFTARAAIHPKHLSNIMACYKPTKAEIDEATQIITAAKNGVGIVNGKMVDEAMAKKAQHIITLSKQ